jgi:hypothetical protein
MCHSGGSWDETMVQNHAYVRNAGNAAGIRFIMYATSLDFLSLPGYHVAHCWMSINVIQSNSHTVAIWKKNRLR